MVSSEYQTAIARRYLVIANMLNVVKIDKLIVPEVAQTGEPVVIDCQFSAPGEFTLQWWLGADGGGRELVYQWPSHTLPEALGVFEGRLDMSYKVSLLPTEEYRAIRILRVDPHLSGEYTCVIISNGAQTQQSKSMLVYSPEEELELTVKRNNSSATVAITCYAFGVYPQPDLILELNKEVISPQVQRVWRRNNLLYEASSEAALRRADCAARAACRLQLPQADYTAIKTKFITFGERCSRGSKNGSTAIIFLLFLYLLSVFSPML